MSSGTAPSYRVDVRGAIPIPIALRTAAACGASPGWHGSFRHSRICHSCIAPHALRCASRLNAALRAAAGFPPPRSLGPLVTSKKNSPPNDASFGGHNCGWAAHTAPSGLLSVAQPLRTVTKHWITSLEEQVASAVARVAAWVSPLLESGSDRTAEVLPPRNVLRGTTPADEGDSSTLGPNHPGTPSRGLPAAAAAVSQGTGIIGAIARRSMKKRGKITEIWGAEGTEEPGAEQPKGRSFSGGPSGLV